MNLNKIRRPKKNKSHRKYNQNLSFKNLKYMAICSLFQKAQLCTTEAVSQQYSRYTFTG